MPAKKKVAPAPKTDALSIRIDPRLRYGLEMMARQQRRSVTGVVEWAIDATLKREYATSDAQGDNPTFNDLLGQVWRPNEVERLVNLAKRFPELLTYEESRLWEVIKLTPDFWEQVRNGRVLERRIRREVLVDQWEIIKPLIEAAADKAVLKGLTSAELDEAGVRDHGQPVPDDFVDDDIPF